VQQFEQDDTAALLERVFAQVIPNQRGLDARLSNFEVTQVLGWAPKAPSLLYEFLYGTLKSPQDGHATSA
jgi:hypothetical protein